MPTPASPCPIGRASRSTRGSGWKLVGVYERVGFKFGAWHDVAWYGMRLSDPVGIPPEPILLPDMNGAGSGFGPL